MTNRRSKWVSDVVAVMPVDGGAFSPIQISLSGTCDQVPSVVSREYRCQLGTEFPVDEDPSEPPVDASAPPVVLAVPVVGPEAEVAVAEGSGSVDSPAEIPVVGTSVCSALSEPYPKVTPAGWF